jgi:hypothetical protein
LTAAVLAGCGGGGGGDPAATALTNATGVAEAGTSAAAATSPAPANTPSAPTGLNLSSFGAACDGRSDDTAAIVRGVAAAKAANQPLVIPAGQCNFSDVLRLDGAKLVGYGASSVLYSTNWQREAIFMSGVGPSVSNVKLTGVAAPSRGAAWEMTRITVMGATDFVIDGVTIEGSAAAGIQTAQAPKRGRITNNVIRNTWADSIHMTDGASYITLEGNLIENSGDDGIAVVSYSYDAVRVNNITARSNIVRNNRAGRNMSVVGGGQILYQNNLLQGNPRYAGILLAQESGYGSKGSDDVRFEGNTIENTGSTTTGHGGILIYSDGQQPINNVVVLNNLINQQGQNGIKAYNPYTYGLSIENNKISGANPALDVSTPGATVVPYTSGTVGYVAP